MLSTLSCESMRICKLFSRRLTLLVSFVARSASDSASEFQSRVVIESRVADFACFANFDSMSEMFNVVFNMLDLL